MWLALRADHKDRITKIIIIYLGFFNCMNESYRMVQTITTVQSVMKTITIFMVGTVEPESLGAVVVVGGVTVVDWVVVSGGTARGVVVAGGDHGDHGFSVTS